MTEADNFLTAFDPEELLADLKRLIRHGYENIPRHTQRQLGPSQIGHECPRHLALQTVVPEYGVEKYNDPLPSLTGTAIHALLETFVPAFNEMLGRERFLAERKVWMREGFGGTADLFDTDTGSVCDWKALYTGTLVPTPSGWSTVGEMQVGDELFDSGGNVTVVTAKTPVWFGRDCYRVVFEDGAEATCDGEHLWSVQYGQRQGASVMKTVDMIDRLRDPRGQLHIRVNNAGPLQLPEVGYPIRPYTLGCWLGDGDSRGGRIYKPDGALFDNIRADGYAVGDPNPSNPLARNVAGLTTLLREAGQQQNKHIPAALLRGSHEQRLALMQGLMDTDGSWNRIRSQAVFCTSRKEMAYDFAELVSSLGSKPRVWELTKRGFGLTVTAYDVTFTPVGFNPFRLPRKADLVKPKKVDTRSRRRVIQSIERVDSVPVQCLSVDAPDRTFLVGKEMIPTHNCSSPERISKFVREGLSGQYRAQPHLYGLGYEREGFEVNNVAVVFLPRGGQLRNARIIAERYDRDIALKAMERYDRILMLADELDVEHHHERFQVFPAVPSLENCRFCPFHSPGHQDPLYCDGIDGMDVTADAPPRPEELK